MARGKGLSQAEVWDDHKLQAQWQASIEEYKKYHSINAKGENVATVLREAAEAERYSNGEGGMEMTNDQLRDTNLGEEVNGDHHAENEHSESIVEAVGIATAEARSTSQPELPMPQALMLQSTQDQSLKDLMMSWYWAGYYTGFYEGQQQDARKNEAVNGS